VLFVGAVIVPCGALIITGARMLSQDRELANQRDAEERRRVAASAGQEIVARLELLRSREERAFLSARRDSQPYADPATVLAAPITAGVVDLPWKSGPDRQRDSVFTGLLARGEGLEAVDHAYLRAVAVYDSAVRIAPNDQWRAYAQLLAARAFAASAATDRLARLRQVSGVSIRLRDEYGVPIALYAERRLMDDSAATDSLFARRIANEVLSARDLSPTACSLAITILADRPPATRGHEIADRCTEVERAATIVDGWRPSMVTGDSTWSLDQSGTLLYSATASSLTIANLDRVLRPMSTRGLPVRVLVATDRGEPLARGLPGLRALPLNAASVPLARWEANRNFYIAALGLVLVAGLTVGLLFWRDMQRDIHLSEMRSQFVAGVSHELKTPLTAIRMYAETLREGRPRDPAARLEYLDTIVAESERLSRLLDNVLDFAKIDRGTKNYSMELRHLPDIVGDAQRIMAHTLSQQGFGLEVVVDPNLPPVFVDADGVEQAVLNLLVNAVKYSGANRRIQLRAAKEGSWAVVTVVDFGIGIAPSERDRIFTQFYRAPGPQNASVPGAGLGLTIVQHVAAAHQGHVRVTSEIGHGSAFSLYLPLADVVKSVAAPSPAPGAAEVTS
jgi:signal transduction histidine kinase